MRGAIGAVAWLWEVGLKPFKSPVCIGGLKDGGVRLVAQFLLYGKSVEVTSHKVS